MAQDEHLLVYRTTVDDTGFKSGMEGMEKQATQTGKALEGGNGSLGDALGSVTSRMSFMANPLTLTTAGMAALGTSVVQATKEFAKFEKELSKVNTLMGASKGEVRALGDEIIQVSLRTGAALSSLTEGAYQALSAGVSEDGLVGFLDTAAKASVAGFTSVETAVDGLTTVMNGYSMAAEDHIKVADQLLTIQNNGKTSVDELSTSLSNVIPVAAAMGVTFEDVGGAIATLTAQGVQTAQATTQIRSALAELGKEGTAVNKTFTELAGKTFPQFIDEGGNLADVFEMLEDHADDTNVSVLDLFSSIEAGSAALALSGNNLDGYRQNIDDINGAVGTLDDSHEIMMDNLESQWEKFMGRQKQRFIQSTAGFSDWIKDMLKIANDTFDQNSLIDEVFGDNANMIARNVELELGAQGLGGKELTDAVREEMFRMAQEQEKMMKENAASRQKIIEDNLRAEKALEESLNAGSDEDDDVEKINHQKEYNLKMNQLKSDQLEQDRAYQAEQLELLEKGWISEKEYTDRMLIYKHSSNQDQLQEQLDFMEQQRAIYEEAGLSEEVASLDVKLKQLELQQLQQIHDDKMSQMETQNQAKLEKEREMFEAEKAIKDQKEASERAHAEMIGDIRQDSGKLMADTANMLLAGEIKSLSEMRKHLTRKLGVIMQSEGAEAAVRGGSDLVKGFSYQAAMNYPQATVAFNSSAQNFAWAAALGVAGGALIQSSDSSSSDISDTRSDYQDENDSSNLDELADDNKKFVVHLDDEDIGKVIYDTVSKYADDSDLTEIIIRP